MRRNRHGRHEHCTVSVVRILVASGIAQVILAFGLTVSGGYRVLLFITGALSLILGVLAFRHFGQGYAVLLLAIWIGVGFIFRGGRSDDRDQQQGAARTGQVHLLRRHQRDRRPCVRREAGNSRRR